MSEEFIDKIDKMLESGDIEMTELAIITLLSNCSYEECKILIPGETISDVEYDNRTTSFTTGAGEMKRLTYWEVEKAWIKGDIMIGIYFGYLFCRPLSRIKHKHFMTREGTIKVYL